VKERYRINRLAIPRAPMTRQTAANHSRHDPLARAAEKANLVSMSMTPVCRRAGLPSTGFAA